MTQLLIPHRDSKCGFSLIELMVVLVLIAIMTAMILPQMAGTYEDALLRSNSRQLVNVLNLAYSRAVSINQLHRVRLDTTTGRYSVERRTAQGTARMSFIPARDAPGTQGQIDTRIHIQIRNPTDEPSNAREERNPIPARDLPPVRNNNHAVTFYPDGTAEPCEIILRDRHGFRLSLRIDPVTARVHIGPIARKEP